MTIIVLLVLAIIFVSYSPQINTKEGAERKWVHNEDAA